MNDTVLVLIIAKEPATNLYVWEVCDGEDVLNAGTERTAKRARRIGTRSLLEFMDIKKTASKLLKSIYDPPIGDEDD